MTTKTSVRTAAFVLLTLSCMLLSAQGRASGYLGDRVDEISKLTPTDNACIVGNGSAFVVESGATLKTSLGLTIGTDVQAYHAFLAALSTSYTTGDVLYAASSSTLGKLTASSTAGTAIVSAGAGAAPVYSGVSVGQPGSCSGGAVTITNSRTLDSSYYGKVVVVTGSTGTVTLTLPTAAAGAGPITIVNEMTGSGVCKVLTSTSGQLMFLGDANCASGGFWDSVTTHSTMTIFGTSSTQWIQQGWDGIWRKDGGT